MTAPTGVSGQSKSALAALSASRQTVHIGHVESETQHATPSGIQKGIANCLSTFSGKLRGLIGGKRAKDVSESQPQPHIEQLSATGIQNNTGEGSEIHQAISDTAQILSKELGLDWDSESMSEILMDPKTIHAIIDKADSMANDISVIFGRLICLQHQIEPYENLALTLKEAGITHNDSQLEKLYAQGFKSETEVKDAVSTSQSFATKLAGHAKFKQAVRYALTERLDILSVHFQRHAMAKMLGITGMSESGISQFKNMLGKQVDLASQDQAGGSLRGVKVMTGSIRSTLNRVLSKRNAMTQLAKIADGEDGKKSSSFKAVRQLATIVRLAILEIMDTSAAPEDALADIQSGKLNDAILSKMTEFGLTDDHFSELGGNGISDMKGLISVETKEFKGAQSVKEWLTAAGMSGKMVRQLQRRESVENKREIANALPTTLAKRETESWLAGIGDGESLVINWGKKVSVGVPEGTKFVQEAFLSGQSLGGKVEVASKDMMLIEKSDKGFTLTIRESSLKSLSIQASFLFQAIKLEGKVGDGKSAGVKFEFATQKEASEFLTGIWTEQIDEESIESSDSVAFEKGKSVAVSGSAAIGSVKQVVAHFLPGLAEITDFIPDFGRTEATGRLNETVDGISTGNPLSAPAGLTMVNALLSKSDEKSDNLLSYSRGKSTEWTESRNIHGSSFEKTVLATVSTEKKGAVTTTNIATKSHVSLTSKNELKEAKMTQTLSVSLPEGKKAPTEIPTKSIALVIPESLQSSNKFGSAISKLIADATPTDQIRVTWKLPAETQSKVTEMMTEGSATYNPKGAQEILGNRKNYVMSSVQLLRASASTSTESKSGIDLLNVQHTETMAKMTVVSEVNLMG